MKSLHDIFPKASKSFIAANPPLSLPSNEKITLSTRHSARLRGIPDKMNNTEREFSIILETRKRDNEISRWAYEAITLRWGGLRYTPDFLVLDHYPDGKLVKFIEVKGPFIREDAMVKFKAARAHWPEFTFELHQRTKQGWRRIY